MKSYFTIFLFLPFVMAKLPCDYLRMEAGNIVVDDTAICLGACPANVGKSGIYIAAGQKLYFNNFILQTTDDNLILTRSGTQLLNCNNMSCFHGIQPQIPLPSGFYLTGQSGGAPVDAFDPWTPISTVKLNEGVFQQVVLTGAVAIRGWRIVVANVSYAFTNQKQLIVGGVSASTIMANPGQRVIADGPVLVKSGQRGCDAGIVQRPKVASVLLIYDPDIKYPDLSKSSKSFTMTVPLNKCVHLPVPNLGGVYLMSTLKDLTLYSDWLCLQISTAKINYSATSLWKSIFLYNENK